MNAPPPLYELRGVDKSFTVPQGRVDVLRGVNLRIEPGDFVAITGPSGSGKSTLLNLVAQLDVPSAGEMWFNGQPVAWNRAAELRRLRRDHIGMVFQQFNLLGERSVLDNVLFGFRYLPSPPPRPRERAMQVLERLGLDALARTPARLLSGGEMQRVAIARALVREPRLLVADEPTGNLDHDAAESLMQQLRSLHGDGLTILLVTHNLDLLRYCTRHLRCADGRFEEVPV